MDAVPYNAELSGLHVRREQRDGIDDRMLHLFFGTNQMDFDLMTSTGTRRYTHFSKAADDVVDVRVLQGIHFRFADTAARTQGRNIAKWAFKRFLRPVDDVESVEAEDEE